MRESVRTPWVRFAVVVAILATGNGGADAESLISPVDFFAFGESEIEPDADAEAELARWADELRVRLDRGPFMVECHAFEEGGAEAERILSELRAEIVLDRLIALGVPRRVLRSVGTTWEWNIPGVEAPVEWHRRCELVPQQGWY